MNSIKIIFAGTPDFAATHLQALLDSQHQVLAILTQPDKPVGRGKKITPSAVKVVAEKNQIPVHQPQSLRHTEVEKLIGHYQADIMIVVAYGLIIPKNILDIPRYGCVNVHGSILPKFRGAAPIQRAIYEGETTTGITLIQMDENLDTGDILKINTCSISPQDNSGSLYHKLAHLGQDTLIDYLNNITTQYHQKKQQDHTLATYAKKLSKQEAKIDWSKDAHSLCNEIRAFNPWPISYFTLTNGTIIKVHQAKVLEKDTSYPPGQIESHQDHIAVATGQYILILETIQFPNKKALKVEEILKSKAHLFTVGTQLR